MVSPILPILSSLLYILSLPNWNLSYLAWVALVPLTCVIIDDRPKSAFYLGWLSGTLAYMGIFYWLIPTFQAAHVSMGIAYVCLLLLAGYLGVYWGLWGMFMARWYGSPHPHPLPRWGEGVLKRFFLFLLPRPLGERVGVRGALFPFFAAATWVALEYLRTYLFSGFPWALLGDSQWRHLTLIQISSLAGVYGVSFLVVMVNATLAWVIYKSSSPLVGEEGGGGELSDRKAPPILHLPPPATTTMAGVRQRLSGGRGKESIISLGVTVLILLCSYLFGHYRLKRFTVEAPTSPPIRVALLQGSIDQYKKWDQAYVDEIERTYEKLNAEAVQSKPDLIVWSETSIPGYMLQDPPLRAWLNKVIQKTRTTHLVGAPSWVNNQSYNAAFLINSKSEVMAEYDKQHLVPFGEIVPWAEVLSRWIHVLNQLGGFTAGQRSPVVRLGTTALGVNICYEAIFPHLVRKSVQEGATLLVNLTNDGWYMRTAAPYQHFAPNVFRAIENNRWVIRADNTGISGIIDPVGQVIVQTPIYYAMAISGTVQSRTYLTFYTRYGDLFAWMCCLALMGLAFLC